VDKEKRRVYNAKYYAEHREERRAKYYAGDKEKIAAYGAAYRAEHKEEIAAYHTKYSAKYRADNPEKIAACRARHYAKHKEEIAAYGAEYRAGHREEIAARAASYRATHRKELAAYQSAYCATHLELHREHAYRRRARKLSSPLLSAYTTPGAVAGRREMYGGKCYLCGAEATEMDHVKPLAKGGAHAPCNLRPICTGCNSKKKDKWPLPALHI
jgi:5-methylcytosine-specific restriction endonuclease McrA